MTARYAIYFIPGADTPLYLFGAAVLGYDSYDARDVPLIEGLDASSWLPIVREPRVYGFHATLKAPFRLIDGASEGDLLGAAQAFAKRQPIVQGGGLALRSLSSFLALVPAEPCDGIGRLAQACVETFDRFRAPMTEAERARRLAAPLTARQAAYLDRWGYPYVADEFRFHMTLTGSLDSAQQGAVQRFLDDQYDQRPDAHTLCIDRIAVVGQGETGAPFKVIQTFALG